MINIIIYIYIYYSYSLVLGSSQNCKDLMDRYKEKDLVDDLIQRKTEQKMYQADENFPTNEVDPACFVYISWDHITKKHGATNTSLSNRSARICVSIGSGTLAKKRMPNAISSPLALPRGVLELARSLGTWCWNPRTTDLKPSLFELMVISIYPETHAAEGGHSDVPWWIQFLCCHARSQAKVTTQSEAGPKGKDGTARSHQGRCVAFNTTTMLSQT